MTMVRSMVISDLARTGITSEPKCARLGWRSLRSTESLDAARVAATKGAGARHAVSRSAERSTRGRCAHACSMTVPWRAASQVWFHAWRKLLNHRREKVLHAGSDASAPQPRLSW